MTNHDHHPNDPAMPRPPQQPISLGDRPTQLHESAPSATFQPPTAGGRLRDHQQVGAGGMGVVWKAFDNGLQRFVAVKRILPDLAVDPDIIARFVGEAQAVAKLRNYKHIVQIFHLGEDAAGHFIEMEWVDGRNLHQVIRDRGPFSPRAATIVTMQVCKGLRIAHQAGIVHRDVKPSNILLAPGDEASRGRIPKLTDFGLALSGPIGDKTLSGQMLGTVVYMAPEQAADPRQATASSDQFSLAATLYQLVTGRSPRTIHLRHVPAPLQDVLGRALEDRPEDRFPSIKAFHDALANVVPELSAGRPAEPISTRSKSPSHDTTPSSDSDSRLSSSLRQKREQAQKLLESARQWFAEGRDEQVLQAIGQLPEHLRDTGLQQRAAERHQRGQALEQEIHVRVEQLRTTELPSLVEEFLQLYPQRTDMAELLAELPRTLQAPFDRATAEQAQRQWAEYLCRPAVWTNSIGMRFRLIPPGRFLMGAPDGEEGASDDEKPQHPVLITRPLYVGEFPVTQNQYVAIMGEKTSRFRGSRDLPVDSVSWNDAGEFLYRLRDRENLVGYRLPTEAEWEYFCRAGTTTPFWFGNQLNGREANCDGNDPCGTASKGPSRKRTSPAGDYPANPFGLLDTIGNVWEWCGDYYEEYYYGQLAHLVANDPCGPPSGSSRVLRGGSWNHSAVRCRCANRNDGGPASRYVSIGFRVVLSVL